MLKDEKSTATLRVTINNEGVMENVEKIGNCFHRKQTANELCSSDYYKEEQSPRLLTQLK